MKNSIKIIAAFLMLGTGAFASAAGKSTSNNASPLPVKNAIIIKGLSSNIGVSVNMAQTLTGMPLVTITDQARHVLYQSKLSGMAGSGKAYNLSELDNGDYFISVTANRQEVKKQVHIYEENGQKTYFIVQ